MPEREGCSAPGLGAHVGGWGEEAEGGGPCTMRCNVSWVMITWNPPAIVPNRMTDITESITFL